MKLNAEGSKNFRSTRPEVYCKKDVLENFAKFTGKHLCQSLFFTEQKKKTLEQVFSCEFCEIFKNTFFIETYGGLLLKISATLVCT